MKCILSVQYNIYKYNSGILWMFRTIFHWQQQTSSILLVFVVQPFPFASMETYFTGHTLHLKELKETLSALSVIHCIPQNKIKCHCRPKNISSRSPQSKHPSSKPWSSPKRLHGHFQTPIHFMFHYPAYTAVTQGCELVSVLLSIGNIHRKRFCSFMSFSTSLLFNAWVMALLVKP